MFFFIEQNPPINEVVQSGVVPRVVKFLSRDDFPKLQVSQFLQTAFMDKLIVTSFDVFVNLLLRFISSLCLV